MRNAKHLCSRTALLATLYLVCGAGVTVADMLCSQILLLTGTVLMLVFVVTSSEEWIGTSASAALLPIVIGMTACGIIEPFDGTVLGFVTAFVLVLVTVREGELNEPGRERPERENCTNAGDPNGA